MFMNVTNQLISAYLSSLYTECDASLKELRDFAEAHGVPIILRDTEDLLRIILSLAKPARILELGAAIGYSACFFAKSTEAEIYTIEREADYAASARNNISQLGYGDRIHLLEGRAEDILTQLGETVASGSQKPFDFVFIDAAKSHYKTFWDLSLPLCTQEALIVCDDILMRGMTASDLYDPKDKHRTHIRNMREFLAYLKELDYADTCILSVGDGISISKLNLS